MAANPASVAEFPAHLPLRLQNVTCPYCGVAMNRKTRTKEHVIGRGFVPRTTLDKQWNLILWACEPCNRQKADLEDDISAVTMQPDGLGRYADDDPRLIEAAKRKAARSFSRRTKKLVGQSAENFQLKSQFTPGITATLNLTSPPQINPERAHELARLQAMAFFYFVTYDQATARGRFWQGSYMPINEATCEDWGNELQVGFMSEIKTWEPRFFGGGADGFFKVAVRRCPDTQMWSLALEWNRKFRVIAAFGAPNALGAFAHRLPKLTAHQIAHGPNSWLRYREETMLPTERDCMFEWADWKII